MTSRVLLVEPFGELGGAQRVSVDLAEASRSFETRVLFLRPGPMFDEARAVGLADGLSAPLPGAGHLTHDVRLIRQAIKSFRPHLLHVSGTSALLASEIAAAIAGLPVVWLQHDPIRSESLRTAAWLRAVAIHPPSASICTTPSAQSSVEQRLPRFAPLHLVANGLRAPATTPEPQRARSMLGISPDTTIIAMFGRMAAYKGHDILVEALPNIMLEFPDATALMVGPFSENETVPTTSRAEALGIGDRVRFLGRVDESTKWDLMAASDVVVHPSAFEPFGLVLIEAMYLSRPVVVARSWGPSWIIENETNGLLFDVGDASGLANCVCRLLRDREASERIAMAGQARVFSHFLFERTMREVESVWSSVSQ